MVRPSLALNRLAGLPLAWKEGRTSACVALMVVVWVLWAMVGAAIAEQPRWGGARIASDIGDVFSRNLALGWLATLLVSAGEPDRAIEAATASIDLVADRGVGHDLVPYAWISLARSYTSLGRIGEVVTFEETGTYKLLFQIFADKPKELTAFYEQTLASLVRYDEQYGTELVTTLATYLERDCNLAATAGQLYTHRHTVRYRLDRIAELSGLDIAKTDDREKLSLGLKAMRLLGRRVAASPRLWLTEPAIRLRAGAPSRGDRFVESRS